MGERPDFLIESRRSDLPRRWGDRTEGWCAPQHQMYEFARNRFRDYTNFSLFSIISRSFNFGTPVLPGQFSGFQQRQEGLDMWPNPKFAGVAIGMLALVFATTGAIAQTAENPPDKKADEVPLSKKLHENDGVLNPPHGVDPEMHQKPPPESSGSKMPIIIPPGEPGGDQSVQPK
jgi:hypothetical protein